MSLTNDQITALNFKDFYNQIRPYLNGEAHDVFLPVGAIIPMMGNTAPLNTLVCDGTVYNIADYPQLSSYFVSEFGSVDYFGGDGTTTFAVPDLRGEFIRGTGTNSHTNQGSGANVGVHQDGTSHTNIVSSSSGDAHLMGYQSSSSCPTLSNIDSNLKVGQKWSRTNATVVSESTNRSISYTSRPTNTSVLYVIVYKNVYADIQDLFTAGDGINIDANNEISTDNMSAADMSEIVTPLPSVMSRMPILFDETGEERVVGWYKFSNGTKKPVYEKTFIFTSPSNATSSKVVENITNLDKCISFEGYITATGCLPLNWYFNSNRYLNTWWDSTVNALYMTCSNSAEQSKDGIVVIRYTKTTDTPA